ncbi:hypothetical protein KUTeg_013059 [Tegillarca granosa]|uniref:Phosphofurin acidic cluster sorting protein 2 n=1 Tax=Tegillarca granosa TaxID=220873 RepID=A0ABQ9EWP2_TEGGR|nr:hypothetical protein KUTeg_013059 [Tegillarca granosa]
MLCHRYGGQIKDNRIGCKTRSNEIICNMGSRENVSELYTKDSKRMLRSNEIILPQNGLLDTELDLSFSLQYPHYLKRDGNKLQVMLQRRKKYKNKTILGYKTLAIGQVNMANVLQRSVDKDLHLFSDPKSKTNQVAKLTMTSLSSQPVDHVINGQRKTISSDLDRSPDVDNYSDDEDDVHGYPDMEESSNDEMSDSEPVMLEDDGRTRPRKSSRGPNRNTTVRGRQQGKIKQRFIALLKKFKVTEEVCITLKPFFTARQGSGQDVSDANKDKDTDQDLSGVSAPGTPEILKGNNNSSLIRDKVSRLRSRSYREKKSKREERHQPRRNSTGVVEGSPRKALLEQLGTVLSGSDDKIPDNILLINTIEWQGQLLVQKLQEKQFKIICTCGDADVKASISFLVSKIQKFCNSNSKSPGAVKVAIAGGDNYINSVLRPYVDQFSAKSHDWQNYVRFLVIPFGTSCIGRYLGTLDNSYASLFLDSVWKDTFEKPELKNPVDFDDTSSMVSSPSLSSSPPSAMVLLEKPAKETQTPPSSPSVTTGLANVQSTSSVGSSGSSPSTPSEYMELQVDYWTSTSKLESSEKGDKAGKKDKESNKSSLKTTFRSLHVQRLAQIGQSELQAALFSMVVVIREKKQKIMRIGKKSKETESKSQVIEGINRLICTSKSQNYGLKVVVDGTEWGGVKFFQLSSQWQTHIKHFPILVFGNPELM